MIRKRENSNNNDLEEKDSKKTQVIEIEDSNIKQPKGIRPELRKEFQTYEEEAIYVLDLLKKQGVDIYDPNRTGGMYLKKKSSKFNSIFKGKNNKESEEINNNEIPKSTLSDFFKNK
jgi:hypothetical protein